MLEILSGELYLFGSLNDFILLQASNKCWKLMYSLRKYNYTTVPYVTVQDDCASLYQLLVIVSWIRTDNHLQRK